MQPKLKETYAIKNPVLLKRNTLALERDAINRNIYYIKFNYDALVDFTVNIYFNAKRTNEASSPFKSSDKFSSLNFQCLKGHNISVFDTSYKIDMEYYKQNKEIIENGCDLVIEFIPDIRTNDNEPILFLTLCELTDEKESSNDLSGLVSSSSNIVCSSISVTLPMRIKVESQKLKTMGMWLEIFDVFNSARESYNYFF